MTHTFQFRDEYFAYDSESGAFHQLDVAAFTLIRAWQDNPNKTFKCPNSSAAFTLIRAWQDNNGHCPECPEEFAPELTRSELDLLCSEIEELVEAGELFSEGEKLSSEQLYPEGVILKAMCLNISHACDLRCKYCFADEGTYGDAEQSLMSFSTGKKAIDFLIEASKGRTNLDIDFFGGEPLLNWKVVTELASYARQTGQAQDKNIRLTLTTNATNLDDTKAEFLNKYFKNIVLSLDGRKQTNDRLRVDAQGQGSYDKVAPNIEKFVRTRGEQEYYIRGTFTKYNLDFAEDALHLAKLGRNISLEPVLSSPGCYFGIELSDIPGIEKEYEKLALAIDALRERGDNINLFHFFLDLAESPCLYKRLKGCGVGLEYCAVTANGDIYPCHQLVGEEEYLLGSVHDDPITLNQAVQNKFQRFLLADQESCLNCWARYHCGGGCAADILHTNQSLSGVNEISCRLLKKRLECALWLAYREKMRKRGKKPTLNESNSEQ